MNLEAKEALKAAALCLACIVGAFALAWALSGCILGGEFISPAEAQRIEKQQCQAKPDAEERRICLSFVAKKYGRYNSEGNYPSPAPSFDPRQP